MDVRSIGFAELHDIPKTGMLQRKTRASKIFKRSSCVPNRSSQLRYCMTHFPVATRIGR